MAVSFDEHVLQGHSYDELIREEWEKHLDGCDYGETNWRQYGLAWFSAGAHIFLAIGQKQGIEMEQLRQRKEAGLSARADYKQGISYAAFQASHMSIDNGDLLGLSVPEAAKLMREHIVSALLAAVKAEEARANAKVEPIL